VKVQLHAFLTLALDGREWSASRPGRFTPRERAPCTPWLGSWVGPRAGLDTVSKRKITSPRRESKTDHPARRQSLYRLRYRGFFWKSPNLMNVWLMFWWGSTDPLFPSWTQNSIQISPHAIFGLFQPRKGRSEARNLEVINGLQHCYVINNI
jgi:hypothetical protein